MRTLLSGLLLIAPIVASAANGSCKHSDPRGLALDLAGVKTLRVETNQHDIRLRATPGTAHSLQGRACASQQEWLADLTLTQERKGDTLVVRARREREGGISSLFGNHYARLYLEGTVPENVHVQLVVGSGDATLDGAASAGATVASGDAMLRAIRGPVTATVGSGDIVIDGAGALKIASIASGDVEARNVGGNVEVDSIGSGDFKLQGARGNLRIGQIASGDATARDVDGSVEVGGIGSGDFKLEGARGNLKIGQIASGQATAIGVGGGVEVGGIGSGDFELDGAQGDVKIGQIASGDAELRNVSGAVRANSIGSGDLDVRGAASLSVGAISSGGVSHRDVRGAIDLPRKR